MKPIVKYALAGLILGGALPALLHLLNVTVMASTTDILTHTASALMGALIGFVIYKLRR